MVRKSQRQGSECGWEKKVIIIIKIIPESFEAIFLKAL